MALLKSEHADTFLKKPTSHDVKLQAEQRNSILVSEFTREPFVTLYIRANAALKYPALQVCPQESVLKTSDTVSLEFAFQSGFEHGRHAASAMEPNSQVSR